METALSKDGVKFLATLYKDYLDRCKAGMGKEHAAYFGSSKDIQQRLVPNELLEDVDETIRELDQAQMVDVLYADDTVYDCSLSDFAIIYMENRFKNGAKDVLDLLSKFIP